ncbi:MAG: hypothetical protein AB7I19_03765 [Planctomycetota bacterium]
MKTLSLGLIVCAWMTAQAGAQSVHLTWRGKPMSAELLAEAPESVRQSVAAWSQFTAATGGRMVLSEDCHTLLVLSAAHLRKQEHKELREVDSRVRMLDQTSAIGEVALPRWTAAAVPAVLVGVRSAHYRALLDHVAALDPRLADWAASAARHVAGFVLTEPLVGAWIEDPQGVEEWQPDNEMVHRAMQLQVRGRVGDLPAWLTLGMAWHAEDMVCRSIYCFPYRDGFVSVGTHSDWGLWLANEFKKGKRKSKGQPERITLEEFAMWQPGVSTGEFDATKAFLAFGFARFLLSEHGPRLAPVLVSIREEQERGRVTWISANEWTTNPGYQLPVADQLRLLSGLDPDLLDAATEFLRKKLANRRVVRTARR